MPAPDDPYVVVGRITGLYGVRGWLRIHSETQPRENILSYAPWRLRGTAPAGIERGEFQVAEGRLHGKGVVARLAGIEDRDAAAGLLQADILVRRSQFGQAEPDEYYWADLVGLEVMDTAGHPLGLVHQLMETGANDVMVVTGERRRLIPFVPGTVVRQVDLAGRRIVVDWDPEF